MIYADWRERLGEANDPEFFPLAWQDELLASGQGQFWGAADGAIITRLMKYPGGALTCETFAGAGDINALIAELKPAIEEWAKQQGCTHCLITGGREGWRRKHPDYRHYQTILYKELP